MLDIRDARGAWVLRGAGRRWRLERWRRDALGYEIAAGYPLDHDARHNRLFLTAADERAVGVAGIAALEKLARRALGGRG